MGPHESAITARGASVPRRFVRLCGCWLMLGGCGSFTNTVKEQKLILLLESSAVQSTVVSPGGNNEPEGMEVERTGRGSSASVTVNANVTGVPPGSTQSTTRFELPVMTGALVSASGTTRRTSATA